MSIRFTRTEVSRFSLAQVRDTNLVCDEDDCIIYMDLCHGYDTLIVKSSKKKKKLSILRAPSGKTGELVAIQPSLLPPTSRLIEGVRLNTHVKQ